MCFRCCSFYSRYYPITTVAAVAAAFSLSLPYSDFLQMMAFFVLVFYIFFLQFQSMSGYWMLFLLFRFTQIRRMRSDRFAVL